MCGRVNMMRYLWLSLRNVCLARCTFLLWAAYYIRWLISLFVGVGDAGLL